MNCNDDIDRQLYDKICAEYELFIQKLEKMTPIQVIEHAYEKVIKEELVMIFENTVFSEVEAGILIELDWPLEALYQEWLRNDFSFTEMITTTITNFASEIPKDGVVLRKEMEVE